MANYTTLSSLFAATASAIRTKTGSTESIKADDFPTAIASISTGIAPSGTTILTSQGSVYNVIPYAFAQVSLPQIQARTYTAATTSIALTDLSNKYIDGTPYIAAITAANLTSDNIIGGKTVKIYSGNSEIISVTGTDRINSVIAEEVSGTSQITFRCVWEGISGILRNFAQFTIPANFYAQYIAFMGMNGDTKGQYDFSNNIIFQWVNNSTFTENITNCGGSWLANNLDGYDTVRRVYKPGYTINIPCEGPNYNIKIICCGYYES